MATVNKQSTYGMQVNLEGTPYEEAVEKATAALKEEGFGVLTEIDVKDTLKEKLDADFRPYVILGACNPPLAKQALDAELEVGALLPLQRDRLLRRGRRGQCGLGGRTVDDAWRRG